MNYLKVIPREEAIEDLAEIYRHMLALAAVQSQQSALSGVSDDAAKAEP